MDDMKLKLEIQLLAKEALAQARKFGEEVKRLAEEAKRTAPPAAELAKAFKAVEADLKRSAKAAQEWGDVMGKAGKSLSLFVTAPILAAGAAAIGTAAKYEMLQTNFETLLGSAEAGAEAFNRIKAMAAQTPFDTIQLSKGAQNLMAAGIAADVVTDKLRILGDASLGNAQKFDSLVNAYSKIRTIGKASFEELRIIMENGIPIIRQMADDFGKNEQEIMKMVTAGKIGFREVDAALQKLTSGTGQFADGMGKGSKTLEGLLSTLKDDVGNASAELIGSFMPAIKDTVKLISEGAKWFGALDEATRINIVRFAMLAATIGPLLGFVSTLAKGYAFYQLVMIGVNAALHGQVLAENASKASKVAATIATWAKVAADKAYIVVMAAASVANLSFAATFAIATAGLSLLVVGIVAAVKAISSFVKQRKDESEATNAAADAAKANALGIEQVEAAMKAAQRSADSYKTSLKALGDEELASARAAVNAQAARVGMRYADSPQTAQAALEKLRLQLQQIDAEVASRKAVTAAAEEAAKTAAAKAFKESWGDTMARFRAETSGSRYALIDYENEKKLAEATANYVQEMNQQTRDEINAYYQAQRDKLDAELLAKDRETMVKMTASRLDDLELEKEKALASFQGSEETRAAIAAAYDRQIADTRTEENRRAAVAAYDLANQERVFQAGLTDSRLDDLRLEADRALSLFEGTEENKALLAAYYARQISDLEIDEAKRAADERIAQTRRAFEDARRLAAEQGRWGEYAAKSASEAAKDTEIGKVLGLGGQPAQDWKAVLIDSALSIAMQNEEVQKVMNIFSTIIKGVVQAVLPPLAKALTWLYDKVIVPVGNGIIGAINGMIKLINKIPGVNIKLVETLQTSEQILQAEKEIASKTQAVSDEMDRIRQVFADRRKDIEDAYRKNVASLQKLLELGVMNEAEYDSRIEAANVAKDVSLDILRSAELQQLDTLEDILDQLKKGLNVSVNVLREAGIPGFAVGAVDITQDTKAVVHKGEMVVSTPFAEGVRRGEISIGGKGNGGSGHVENYYIDLTVQGSVLTKDKLVDEIAVSLETKRKKGTLPAGAR
jgi:tape measure domain-containing protein